jgi:hypothetical protein
MCSACEFNDLLTKMSRVVSGWQLIEARKQVSGGAAGITESDFVRLLPRGKFFRNELVFRVFFLSALLHRRLTWDNKTPGMENEPTQMYRLLLFYRYLADVEFDIIRSSLGANSDRANDLFWEAANRYSRSMGLGKNRLLALRGLRSLDGYWLTNKLDARARSYCRLLINEIVNDFSSLQSDRPQPATERHSHRLKSDLVNFIGDPFTFNSTTMKRSSKKNG